MMMISFLVSTTTTTATMHGHPTRCPWQDGQGMRRVRHPAVPATQRSHQIYVHDMHVHRALCHLHPINASVASAAAKT